MRTNWKTEPLGNVATLQRGFDLPHRQRSPGPFPIVTSSGIEDVHCEAMVKGPGVVTGRYGTVGKVFFVSSDFWPLNTTLYVRDFHGNRPLFVYYLLSTLDFYSYSGKTGVPGVNRNDLHEIEVHLPSNKTEQEAIAKALSDADALIESLEQLIAKKRQIKQGAMQELLTGKKRLPSFEKTPGYKKTEMGMVPQDWITSTLENATTPAGLIRGPFGGALKKEFFVERGFKVYEQKNAIDTTAEEGNYFIDADKFKELGRFRVCPGDFIVSCSGTIGCIYRIPEGAPEGVINQALLKITLNREKIDDRFFLAVFQSKSFQERIKESSHGGAMPNLVGMGVFKKTTFPLPSNMAEQEAIASVLCDMDAEITSLESKLAKVRMIKQGMMQELLTGRTRLV